MSGLKREAAIAVCTLAELLSCRLHHNIDKHLEEPTLGPKFYRSVIED